jgi:uncharacterized protein YodC (DUF2158 family)
MSNAIEIGQVVTLQSGGPSMTVRSVDGSKAQCVWFEGTRLKSEQFDAVLLRQPLSGDVPDDIYVNVDNFG